MQLCAHSNGPSYAGGLKIDEIANLSFFEGAGGSRRTSAYRIAPVSQTFHEAYEGFIERLSSVIIGSRTRYFGLDDLVQEVRSYTQAVEPAWIAFVNNVASAIDMLTISETIESIASDVQAHGPRSIDLNRIDRKSPSPQHLVALLRTTYAFKDEVRGWAELRDFAKKYVDEKGFVSARVMKGLDD